MAIFILGVSAVLQFIAAMYSVRLIKVTGKWQAWALIATAMTLMGVRRSITLYRTITGDTTHSADMTAEFVALIISILMVSGVFLIGPMFRKAQSTNETLRISEERNSLLLDSTAEAIYGLDMNGNCTFCNVACLSMLSYENQDDLLGKNMHALIHHTRVDGTPYPIEDCHIYKAFLSKEKCHVDTEILYRKDGSYFPAEYWSYPTIRNGKIVGAVVTFLNISKRKQAEKILRESEKKYRGLLETAPDGMVIVNAKGEIEIINQQLQEMTGFTLTDLIGLPVEKLIPKRFKVHKQQRDSYLTDAHVRMMGEGKKLFVRRKDGSEFPVEISLSPSKTMAGLIVSAAIRDISEREKTEIILQKKSKSISLMGDIASIANESSDFDRTIKTCLSMICSFSGWPIGHYYAMINNELCSTGIWHLNHPEKFETFRKVTEKAYFTQGIGLPGRVLSSGKPAWIVDVSKDANFPRAKLAKDIGVCSGFAFPIKIGSEITGVLEFFSEESLEPNFDMLEIMAQIGTQLGRVAERMQSNNKLIYQAKHDALTGLVNRREFEHRVERLLVTVKQDKDEHALCFMDLDQFKVVNDTCGHVAGDELLRQLGSVLQNTVRHRDTLARLGGDEFGVLMEHCSLDDAHRVAISLQKAIQSYQFLWEERSFKVGVSMGLVPITSVTINLTELLKDADAACYMAKDKGRNCIHLYHTEDTEIAQRHGEMQWVVKINQALEEDMFCLYAQAIVPLDGSAEQHYELLLRMVDSKGKIIPPGAFLPAAERYDLIEKLDTWVIENAFSLLTANPLFLKQVHFISINLSGQSLAKQEFLTFIISELDKSGIDAEKICFEITETSAISNLNSARKFISTLKGLGCQFALDDFGSGLSSFAYLKNLPVDYLKIDGMFVKDIVDDPIDHAMVKSINEIGHVMGMQTIAEFVENDEIKAMLREIGVDYAQGYGIGKPQPFDELMNVLH